MPLWMKFMDLNLNLKVKNLQKIKKLSWIQQLPNMILKKNILNFQEKNNFKLVKIYIKGQKILPIHGIMNMHIQVQQVEHLIHTKTHRQ